MALIGNKYQHAGNLSNRFSLKNGTKESCILGMFHIFIRLLLVEVELYNILWELIPLICNNYYKTLTTSPIKNSLRNKVFVHSRHWFLTIQLPLAVNTYTDHFYKITLNYVEFVQPSSWPTLFLVVVDIVSMNVRTYSEPSRIYTQNSLSNLCKLLVLRESSRDSISSLTISTIWPRGLINHLIALVFSTKAL